MSQIKIVQDLENHTLMVFFGDPGGEVHSEASEESGACVLNHPSYLTNLDGG